MHVSSLFFDARKKPDVYVAGNKDTNQITKAKADKCAIFVGARLRHCGTHACAHIFSALLL